MWLATASAFVFSAVSYQRMPCATPFCFDERRYGLVCSAEDKLTGRKVAIKRVGNVFQDLIDAKRILREIKLLRHLGRHENVVELMDLMTGPPETQNFKHLYVARRCDCNCAGVRVAHVDEYGLAGIWSLSCTSAIWSESSPAASG